MANGIEGDEKRRAVFLSVIGAPTYRILRNLVTPDKPSDKPYKDLLAALSQHFHPKPSEIVERYKFHSRVRKPGESVATFVAELRSMTEHCNFGDSLELMIRDRLVCGINDSSIQTRLLAETDLTYERAIKIALTAETASQSVRQLRVKSEGVAALSPPRQQAVYRATATQGPHSTGSSGSQGPRASGLTCYRCGRKGHTVTNCKVPKDVVCHRCSKRGHLQRVCKSPPNRKTRTVGHVKPTQTVGHVKPTEAIEDTEDDRRNRDRDDQVDSHDRVDEDTSALYHLLSPEVVRSPPITVKVRIDNCEIDMEVDTGASHSLMSEGTFRSVWPRRSLHPTSIRLQGYSKQPIPSVRWLHCQGGLSGPDRRDAAPDSEGLWAYLIR